MKIKRFHLSKRAAHEYIRNLGYRGRGLEVFKVSNGKFWVGTFMEWLNR
jgi:hypothetical protein